MFRGAGSLSIAVSLIACSVAADPCFASPYELTVYSDDIPEKGEAEGELILSLARPRPDDDVPNGKIVQGLFEYSLGIAPGLAIGLELPLVHAQGATKFEGLAVELQFVAPHADTGFYWGLRSDIGYERSVYEARGGNGVEINPIIGYRWSSAQLVLNPSVEIPLSGESKRALFEPAAKLQFSVDKTDAIGVEYYGNMGPVRSLLPHRRRDEMVYLVWDRKFGKQQISLGVGQPLSSSQSTADKWVAKAALSFELD
jgi:hypothetical protein